MTRMELVQIPFGTQTYVGRSGYANGERVKNWYAEKAPAEKAGVVLYPTPGTKTWLAMSGEKIRGMLPMGDALYVVIDNDCYRVDAAKNAVRVGYVTDTGPVQMTTDGTHVAVCTPSDAYAINDLGVNLLEQKRLIACAYQDGYTIFVQGGTQFVWISGLDDMTTINGLDFTSKDALPDNVMGIEMDNRELIVFGKKSTEILYNDGASAFPFVRNPSGFIERGLFATAASAKSSRGVFFLGDDKRVYAIAQYRPTPVSTRGIENLINNTAHPDTASMECYFQAGHEFIVLSFSDLTLVFDIDEGVWHERYTYGHGRWMRENIVSFAGKTLVTGHQSNIIYELDLETYDDEDVPIVRECEFPLIDGKGGRYAFHRLYLDFDPGQGVVSGDGESPNVMLDWSDDGGRTRSNQLVTSIGKMGEYSNRAVFNRLGAAYQRRFRVSVSAPVKAVLTNAAAMVEPRN